MAFVYRSYASSKFPERRHQSFDAKRANRLRCGRFGRFAGSALQHQQAQHQSQNIPQSDRVNTQLDYCNGRSTSLETNCYVWRHLRGIDVVLSWVELCRWLKLQFQFFANCKFFVWQINCRREVVNVTILMNCNASFFYFIAVTNRTHKNHDSKCG